MRLRRRSAWLAACSFAAAPLPAACARTGASEASPSPSSECVEVCIVEVENRTSMQLDVILRDGLSVRTLGAVGGYATGSFEVPAGIPLRNVDARLTPGAGATLGAVVCHFRPRGEAAARLVCDSSRG